MTMNTTAATAVIYDNVLFLTSSILSFPTTTSSSSSSLLSSLSSSSNSFQNSTLTMQQTEALRITAGTTASLSILGSMFIIVSSLLFGDLFKSLAHRLIMYLSFADLIASCSYMIRLSKLDLLKNHTGEVACKIEAYLMTTFEMSSVFWSSAICMHLLLSIMLPDWRVERIEPVYHVLSWGYPLLWSSIVLGMNRFGRASNWCWLIPDEAHHYFSWRFFTFLPVYILMFFNIAVYIGVCVSLRRMLRQSKYSTIFSSIDRRKELKALRQLSIIMIAFFITWIPPMVNRLVESLSPMGVYFWLDMAQALTNPLQGFCNLILYGYRFVPRYYRALKWMRDVWMDKRVELHELRNEMEKAKRRHGSRHAVFTERDSLRSNDILSLVSSGGNGAMDGSSGDGSGGGVYDNSAMFLSGSNGSELMSSSGASSRPLSFRRKCRRLWRMFSFWVQYYCFCVCFPCGLPDKKQQLSVIFGTSTVDSLMMTHQPSETTMSFLRPPSSTTRYIPSASEQFSESETDDDDAISFGIHQQYGATDRTMMTTPDKNRHRPYVSESSPSRNISFVPSTTERSGGGGVSGGAPRSTIASSLSPQTPSKYYIPDSMASSISSPDLNRHQQQYDGVSSLADSVPMSMESRHARFMFSNRHHHLQTATPDGARPPPQVMNRAMMMTPMTTAATATGVATTIATTTTTPIITVRNNHNNGDVAYPRRQYHHHKYPSEDSSIDPDEL